MARSPVRSLHWLTLAIMLPLVVLAVLAWLGSRRQLDAAWTDAREEATHRARAQASDLASRLAAAAVTIPVFPDPPLPGPASGADAVLDGTDIPALLALRNNPEAGLSPAGLPRRVLAALRVHALDPEAQSTDEIVRLVTTEEPSILSRTALEVVGASAAQLRAWDEAEEIRAIVRRIPEAGDPGFWIREDSRALWIETDRNTIRYLLLDRAPRGVTSRVIFPDSFPFPYDPSRPSWLHFECPLLLELQYGEGLPRGGTRLLADVPVGFGSGIRVEAFALPRALEANARVQQGWTIALLATAVVVAGCSLLAIQRVVARERKLANLKSQFVSSVSHELRAPLGSIRLMAEALEQGKVKRPGEFHTLIAREGNRLSHLIENVLDFSRIEDGRKRYQFEDCDLTALMRDALELMAPLARDRNVEIEHELTEVTATLDPAAIQQAVVNLLDNAIKFSPEQGRIEVTLRPSAGSWSLSVRDHGPGIPAAEQERIFERFHRLGNELRREHRGTGIGLSIVKHIAEAHGGTITVASSATDGSTFTLSLPIEPCASS